MRFFRGAVLRSGRVQAVFWGVLLGTAWAGSFEVPPRTGWVVDQTGVLSAPVVRRLNAELERLQGNGGPQIQVVVVPSLQGESVERAALKVAEQYRLGHAGRDNGVLLFVSLEDRALRIEVGRGLEGVIPDARAGQIIRHVIVPEFRAERFERGILAGVNEIARFAGAEVPVARSASRRSAALPRALVILIYGLVALLVVVAEPWLNRLTRGASRRGAFRHPGPGGFSGRGGWGGGGGGVGGFSGGGGGGFSGGGASGRW